jgi:hypothetical protein
MGVKNELFPLKCIWLLLHCLALPRWQVISTFDARLVSLSTIIDNVCRLHSPHPSSRAGDEVCGASLNKRRIVCAAAAAYHVWPFRCEIQHSFTAGNELQNSAAAEISMRRPFPSK